MRPKLFILVERATHFLSWERSIYARYFDLVDSPGPGVAVHGYAPDVLDQLIASPASHRSIYMMPGWIPTSPFYDVALRDRILLDLRHGRIDLLFADRGPVGRSFGTHGDVVLTRPSLSGEAVKRFRVRTNLDSLLHLSADYPQKDWQRSERIMQLSGLDYLVYPPRGPAGALNELTVATKLKKRANRVLSRLTGGKASFQTPPSSRYVEYSTALSTMAKHDGFVHVAGPKPPRVDNMYTLTVLEAAATGAIVFWHDTHGCGAYLDTFFDVGLDPESAAKALLAARESLDVPSHSRATRDEVMTVFSPATVVAERCEALRDRLA